MERWEGKGKSKKEERDARKRRKEGRSGGGVSQSLSVLISPWGPSAMLVRECQ